MSHSEFLTVEQMVESRHPLAVALANRLHLSLAQAELDYDFHLALALVVFGDN